jgi:hypothetical protein
MMKQMVIVVLINAVHVGVPVGGWALGYVVRGLGCCPRGDLLETTIQVAPLGMSLGVIAVLVVTAYERL